MGPDMTGVAIITGATKGLGVAFAQQLAPSCKGLVITGRNEAELEGVAAGLREAGHQVVTHVGDMRDEGAPAAIVAAAASLGGADILVNNAGIVEYGPFLDISREQLRRLLAIDVESVFFMTQAFAADLKERAHPGVIINLGTSHALTGVGGTSGYAAAKGGVHALTRALAVELAPFGIRVNTLALGTTMTERVKKNLSPELLNQRYASIPLGRGATAEEAARALEYLVEAEFATGTELVLDGGFTIFGDR
ncbi:MAG: SDR family oxidoreductase [Hyphomicrobiales bacterium]|nr:MAG: SDR family oxidoreductase [Hyphomicrobiales bacterium]